MKLGKFDAAVKLGPSRHRRCLQSGVAEFEDLNNCHDIAENCYVLSLKSLRTASKNA
jgi:hypothetical protein